MERDRERSTNSPKPSTGTHQRPKKSGRPKNRWKIRVVCIDARKYSQFARDSGHPFTSMAAEARIEEIDSFCARIRARRKKRKKPATGQSAAA